jgi:DNA-binding beta-propeller fold protein YncE
VADGYNDRVQVFSATGEFTRKWGGPLGMNIYGPFPGWFATVTSVEAGPSGNVFVADFYNHRVQKFDGEGRFLTAFGGQGSEQGQFEYVTAVVVSENGAVFATDLGNHRVLVFKPSG